MSKRATILVIEDDPGIRSGIVSCLELEQLGIIEADTWANGHRLALHASYDAIILDLALPGGDGIDILTSLRQARITAPVLIVTARGAEPERVLGLRAGADDYLVKPFGWAELSARIEALLRRCGSYQHNNQNVEQWSFGDTEVQFNQREVCQAGQPREQLSEQDCTLLQCLIAAQGGIISRSDLQQQLWPGQDADLRGRAIDMAIARLRQALGPAAEAIITVRGQGYKLAATQQAP